MNTQDLMTAGETAVKEAVRITRKVQEQVRLTHSITKDDHSPVTIADFAAQALVCLLLGQSTPRIPIVAEETSSLLANPAHSDSAQKILSILHNEGYTNAFSNLDDLFSCIDLGGQKAGELFWTLDPIDGTKGFLRGEQFAVALALIEKGAVRLAVIGCPRLSIADDPSTSGYLFLASQDSPCIRKNLQFGSTKEVRVSGQDNPADMRFVQSYESAHGNLPLQHRIAEDLGFWKKPVQMDSQVKYCIVACGQAEVYVRIPNAMRPDYREKIWDHAAGALLVERAGGCVTDINGNALDFSQGKTLARNRGIIAAIPQIHPKIVKLIKSYSELSAVSL